jgi:hypothetical protein
LDKEMRLFDFEEKIIRKFIVNSAIKNKSREIARPIVVPRIIYANQRQQVWWIHPTRQNIKNKHDTCMAHAN